MKALDSKKTYDVVMAMLIMLLMCMLIVYPQITFEGATEGMDSWLKIVFPALLPFFVGAEIMISMGIVDFMSVLLTPIMGPLFGCSGTSSFVWAMSATSGYPTCARLVTSLLRDDKIDTIEGQKILAFASTSGPLFMLGAVGIGMLNSPIAGRIIAVSHYISAIIIGLCFKYYGGHSNQHKGRRRKDTNILKRAVDDMYIARNKDGRRFGQILGDSIKSTFETLTMVGGFLILFSSLIHLLLSSNIMHIFQGQGLVEGIVGGILEMTTGCMIISQSTAPFAVKIAGICFVIGWSGISVHCQVASMLSRTNISLSIYIATKLAHGILSGIIGWCIAKIVYAGEIQAFNPSLPKEIMSLNFVSRYSLKLFLIAVTLLCSISIAIGISHKKISSRR